MLRQMAWRWRSPGLATLLVLIPSLLAAQPTGSIEGRVLDSTGSALPGVTVTLVGGGGIPEGPQITAANGRFSFGDVPAGDYLIEAALSGFETRGEPVSVEADAVTTLELILELSRVMEAITVVAEEPRSFATNIVAEPMVAQQSPITSVLAVVDNLPGVSIQEGDAYGTDDWSTSISMRGFQVNLDEAQIGTTIDGMPNGTSDYWSGSKANRFVDPANMGGVTVSQGTADIASRSIEALGGTLDFTTDEPEHDRKFTAALDLGSDDGQRFYLRMDTGHLFDREIRAWVSAVRQEAAIGCRVSPAASGITSPERYGPRPAGSTSRRTSRTTTPTTPPTRGSLPRPNTAAIPVGTA